MIRAQPFEATPSSSKQSSLAPPHGARHRLGTDDDRKLTGGGGFRPLSGKWNANSSAVVFQIKAKDLVIPLSAVIPEAECGPE